VGPVDVERSGRASDLNDGDLRSTVGQQLRYVADAVWLFTVAGTSAGQGALSWVDWSWLRESSIAEFSVASLATRLSSVWESRKFVLSSVIKAPEMMAMNAVMIRTPLSTLPRCERLRSFSSARMAVTGSHADRTEMSGIRCKPGS